MPRPNDSRMLGLTSIQLFCSILAALGTLNFGWDNGIVNIPGSTLSSCSSGPLRYDGPFPSCLPTSSTVWGVVVGCLALGALVGSITASRFSDKFGRKPALFWGNLFAVVGAILLSTTTSLGQFVVGRILTGFQAGSATAIVAAYIGEITTPKARTTMGAMLQLSINVGIFVANAIALGMTRPPLWRGLFAITALFSGIAMIFVPFAVESPSWLISKGRIEDARNALLRLRKGSDITEELNDLVQASREENAEDAIPPSTVWQLIKGDTPDNLRHQLIVISALMFFQQFSGINAVIFFSTKIIDAAKHSDPHNLPTVSQIIAFSISAVAVVFTVVGMVLISFFGRRTLMLVSHGAMCIFCLCLALGSIYGIDAWVIAMVYFFNIFFNFGAGPLPWASAAEMTPKYAMSAMTSVGNAINFLFTFTIGAMFPPLADSLGDYTFLFFMGWNLLAFVFVFLYLPETKDRRVEDVIRVHSTGFHVVLGRTVPPLHAMPSKVGMASMLSNESSPGSATAADPSEQGEKNQIVLEKYTSEQSSNVAAGEDGGLEFQAPRHHPDSIKEIA